MACLDFVKGSSQRVRVADNLGIDGGNITISVWFSPKADPTLDTVHGIAEHGSTTSKVEESFGYANAGGTKRLRFDRRKVGVSDNTLNVDGTLTLGAWYHLALVYDGTNIEAYVDGVSRGTLATSGSGTGATNSFFAAGVTFDDSELNYGTVRVKHVAVYDAALSAANVNRVRMGRPPDNDANLVLYWPIDEGTGSSTADHAGTAQNGTITGATWVADGPPITYK